jgi:pheromone shutdown protein TraB
MKRYYYPTRGLSPHSYFLSLSLMDVVGVVLAGSFIMSALENTRFAPLGILVVMVLIGVLSVIRIRYRRRILRDVLGFAMTRLGRKL